MSNVQFISGGLANKVKEWQKISSDPWILSTESGYKIEFDETPFQYKIPLPIKFNQKQTEIIWSETESVLHINVLEIMAIKFALQSLCQNMESTHICIRSDNSVAVSFINNQGGSILSLFEEAKSIWLWCDIKNIIISAVHIAGKNNVTADHMSRSFSDSTEWKLNEKVFNEICNTFFYPDIDLFASRLNRQLEKYISWFPDPQAITSDAFSIN